MRSSFHKPVAFPVLALLVFSLLSLVSLAKEWDFYNLRFGYIGYHHNDVRQPSRFRDGPVDVRSRIRTTGSQCKSWAINGYCLPDLDRVHRSRRSVPDTPRSSFEAATVFDADSIAYLAEEPSPFARGVRVFKSLFTKQTDDSQISNPLVTGSASSVVSAPSSLPSNGSNLAVIGASPTIEARLPKSYSGNATATAKKATSQRPQYSLPHLRDLWQRACHATRASLGDWTVPHILRRERLPPSSEAITEETLQLSRQTDQHIEEVTPKVLSNAALSTLSPTSPQSPAKPTDIPDLPVVTEEPPKGVGRSESQRRRMTTQVFSELEAVIVSTPSNERRLRVRGVRQSPEITGDDVIEVSSVNSEQSYHTAVVPQEEGFHLDDGGAQASQMMRLQRAVEERTGRVKDEDLTGDIPLLTQNPMFTNGVIQPSVARSNGEDPPVHLSQDMADHLVLSYLTREYANLPILDLLQFQSAYESTRTEQDIAATSSSFHGILNTIFGLSGLSATDVNDEDVTSFFNRGQRMSRDMETSGSLCERIQSFILQSQYLYAIGNSRLAWMFIGFAIRTAQVLGLHLKTGGHDARGRRDRELARRLWHSAMILERMIALQLGLPPQTSNPLRVPLPTHWDTDYIDFISGGNPPTTADRPSLIEFLTACARLYSHVEDILAWEDELRMQPNSCAAKKLLSFDFKIFLKVDTLLYDWQTSLPSYLKNDAADGIWNDPVVCRQRNVLRARYLYVRLRLYRPLLALGLALSTKCNCRPEGRPHATKEEPSSSTSPVVFSMVRDASIKSVAVALELINLIRTHEDGPRDGRLDQGRYNLISPYWENIDYIYACGTVFLAARLSNFSSFNDNNSGGINEGEVETSLTRAIDMLDHYHSIRPNGKVARIAQLCCNTLKTLSDVVKKPGTAGPSTGAAAVLNENTRDWLLGRTENSIPALNRTRRQSIGDALAYYGWIESLPIDLAGPLE
ncbi:hypothetical protein APSETT444_005665 [Aspergillus pseudonomiae]